MICNQPNVRVPVDFEGHHLKIKIDALGKKVWVCIDEQSVFRAQHLGSVTIEDDRTQFQKESLAEVLYRQAEKGNPLLTVLQGTVARLEEMMGNAKNFFDQTRPVTGGEDTTMVMQYFDETEAFIEELQVAGLYRELILKVQRPIETNAPEHEAQLLIYNENRSLETMITMGADIMLMFGADYKMFVKARFWVDGTLQLAARVEEQSW